MGIDDGRVIPNFVKQALIEKDLTVYGDGTQTRSFCYISDLIDGFLHLMDNEVQTPVNLGNSDEQTILNLAELVTRLTGSESGITHKPLPPDDPQVRRPDITKAREQLDWEPNISLERGLKHSIRYFNQIITQPITRN
jgi:dTDP-glucose 4,6-dehydratase